MDKMKSTQEAFTKIVLHLRKQGARSLSASQCMYRGGEGLSCAVGCIIDDEHYHVHLEGASLGSNNPSTKKVIAALTASGWNMSQGDTFEVLCAMQEVHDDTHVESWEPAFAKVAKTYGLGLPAL